MRFTRTERVIYDRNPLKQVVCQLRFDPLLRISAEQPVEFQTALMSLYPILEVTEPVARFSFGSSNAMDAVQQAPQASRTFNFSSVDRIWMVSLASDSLALVCTSYARWERFRDRFIEAGDHLIRIYAPQRVTRVGLRYINVIDPTELTLNSPWAEIINPELIAPIVKDDSLFGKAVTQFEAAFSVILDDGKLTFRHGLGKNPTTGATVYLIDGDFYDDQPGSADFSRIGTLLRSYNEQAGGLFRRCIQDSLHQFLGPHQA